MIQPGRDDNYPTSSGNVPNGLLATQFGINGFHISVGLLAFILAIIIAYNIGKGKRRR